MSYTTNRQPQGTLIDKVNFLREGMIAEIVAINDYSHFIKLTNNKEIKEIFHHIMEEEKEHYGLFLNALRKYDKKQEEYEAKVKNHQSLNKKDFSKYSDFSLSKTKDSNLLDYLREAIKGELEAISLYEFFISNISDDFLIALINKIINDEREHIEELTLCLTFLDKDKYGPLSK
ncbi:ferritin family protein [Clostridium chrysemydis]|uniref:ferritin family protein n=1 Tax=Clostridium chrysemydis TaxID=2665504 RepID=UPI0018846301|nr:ferritin family protein [Clostridium chrysemydis]